MGKQNFLLWIASEVQASRHATLSLLAKRDEMLYVQAPALRAEYMAKIGDYETSVLEIELDVAMLRLKIDLIQTALNRRESIDMTEIDRKVEEARNAQLAQLEYEDRTSQDNLPVLSQKELSELRDMYRSITRNFHPQMNPGITQTQRELYDMALDAYRRQNLEAMRLIYDMLYDTSGLNVSISLEAIDSESSDTDKALEFADALGSDYSLAEKLYPGFAPTEQDGVLEGIRVRQNEMRSALEAEIAELSASFPFSALETIRNTKKTEEYLAELRVRYTRGEEDKASLEQKIQTMIGAAEK